MGKITKYTKCILVTRCKSDHHVCLKNTRQMMKIVTMLNKKCSVPFCKGVGCPHYWWHQVLYGIPSCHYLALLTLATLHWVVVFTIWGNIGSPNHYVSQMVKCFTNILGMSCKTYPTIGSTTLVYTYLCTYLGSSPKLVLHKVFLIPCTKAQND
jgi:hypothetical protein